MLIPFEALQETKAYLSDPSGSLQIPPRVGQHPGKERNMYAISQVLWRASAALLLAAGLALLPLAVPAHAATATGCEGGGFVIKGLNDGSEVGTDGATIIPAGNLGQTFLVDGRYVEFM